MDTLQMVVIFSLGVGITISVDIFFFTLAKAAVEKLSWRNWTIPAAITHVLLMGIVVGLFYLLGNSFEFLRLPLGLLGATVIGRYLYEVSCDWRDVELKFSVTNWMEKKFGDSLLLSWLSASVLAVSWDCIPVAAGIATETDTWTVIELGLGLLVIGATVASATQTSLWLAGLIKHNARGVSKRTKLFGALVGNWVVFSLLGGFLLLSLAKSLTGWLGVNFYLELHQTLPVSTIMASIFFLVYRKTLWETQVKRSE
jgi:hypothetical protein